MELYKYKKFLKLNENSEFSFQRLNPDTMPAASFVRNPSLSIDGFDRHQNKIQQALSKIGNIHKTLGLSTSYKDLKSLLNLKDQDITSLTIIKITKNKLYDYNIYIRFTINEQEYWGVIKNFLRNPELNSELFKDVTNNLIQTNIWVKKIKGKINKYINNFIDIESGEYKILKDEIICYSNLTGKMHIIKKGEVVKVLKTLDSIIMIEYNNKQFKLKDEYFIYFNWWFEKIKS